jgi:protein O-mannosyl-transferase
VSFVPFVSFISLSFLTAIAYANSLGAGFAFDSKGLILQNARVQAATSENVALIFDRSYWWPIGESGLYRPLTTLSYLFNYAILGNGDRPLGYHVVNLIVHLVNVLLLYALALRVAGPAKAGHYVREAAQIRRGRPSPPTGVVSGFSRTKTGVVSGFSRTSWIAFAIAALWAVHPLGTEAVTNIVGRADLFAATAVLGGLLMHLRLRDSHGWRHGAWLVALAAITLFGVFSKESAVALVAVIALYEIAWWGKGSASALAWSGAAVLAAVLFMWQQRSIVLNAAPAVELPYVDNPIAGAGVWHGRLTAVAMIARYLVLVVWPARLSADYSYAQVPLATGSVRDWIAWATAAALAAAVVILYRRDRAAFFFGVFALLTFMPASNLIVPTGTIMAERLIYLPMAGVVALIVLAIDRAARAAPTRWLVGALAVAIVALTARTIVRNRDWHSDLTLWSSTVRTSPLSFKAHRALAEALYEPGAPDATAEGLERAIAELEQAVAVLSPLPDVRSDARTYRQLGAYYLERGDRLGRHALETDSALPEDSVSSYRKSIDALTRCLAIIAAAAPPHGGQSAAADANRLLSAAYVRVKDAHNAIDAAARARALEPSSLPGHQQLTSALLTAERYDDAAVALMVGALITNRAELRQQLIAIYRQGVDPLGCAVAPAGNSAPGAAVAALDPGCPTVRRHLCAASAVAIELQTNAGRNDDAQRLRTAANDLGCR